MRGAVLLTTRESSSLTHRCQSILIVYERENPASDPSQITRDGPVMIGRNWG